MTKIPVLLLAAGSSSRMGQPKQLLPWGNTTLIEHQIIKLVETGNSVCVVLGCNSKLIIPVIEKFNITITINDKWNEGMGSTISHGINQIIRTFTDADAVLIALSDQPLVPASYFEKIISSFSPASEQILISQSGSGWSGVPAIFDKFYYKELSELNGNEGAKKIISRYPEKVTSMDAGEMLEDIDTPESYKILLSKYLLSLEYTE